MDISQLTPMFQEYMAVKNQHPDELLFYRLGDFYELFFDDALTVSRELGLTLTGRAGGLEERIPMCGVPYHSVEGYLAKLVKKGYRIAVCEQVEDPKLAKGLVKREVIRVITPGTALKEQLLSDAHNRFLAFLQEEEDELALCAADVSTGECQWFVAQGADRLAAVEEQLYRLQPAEVVVVPGLTGYDALTAWLKTRLPDCALNMYQVADAETDFVQQHFGGMVSGASGAQDAATRELPAVAADAVRGLLDYLHATVMADLSQVNTLTRIDPRQFMELDATALRNLELLRNMRDGGKRGTLLGVLDFTCTSMGSRLLQKWIEQPLLDLSAIVARQDAVEECYNQPELREELQDALKQVYDLERIVARLEVGTANARDLVSLRTSLAALPQLKTLLVHAKAPLLIRLCGEVNLHQELLDTLVAAVVDEPPFTIREGGMIRDGYDLELDELHATARDNTSWMQQFEAKIKESTGIKTLKVGFNKVFGYYIEVSKGQTGLVPDNFVRKQTLVNAERYIVPELREFENKILSAKEKIQQLEYYLFNQIREAIRKQIPALQATARALAQVDVLAALAKAAVKYDYHRPLLNDKGYISVTDGRHPVVERLLEQEIFVPNDVHLDRDGERMLVLTGPNMAGKSTYMRQVALLVLLAQMGSFIPAKRADICPVDRIFTRIGGRGTSTFDGMSIARSVMEYIAKKIQAKTLFATHYHQLIALEDELPGVKNYSVAIKERGNDIVFLRRIVRGGTDRSYGVHVARLAGLPRKVLQRADELLKEYDAQAASCGAGAVGAAVPQGSAAADAVTDGGMSSLFSSGLQQELLQLDVMSMTPIEAMNTLYKLQAQAKQEAGM